LWRGVAWPPSDQNRAKTLGLVLTAKDRLSHAAFPATGHSVAFTYLATNSPAVPSVLHLGIVNLFRPTLVRGPSILGRVKGEDPSNVDDRGATNPGTIDATDSRFPNASTMAQFARDAFPGLAGKGGWLAEATNFLSRALLLLLVATCIVGWDLAVGQRLLADYRWFSQNPDVMQVDAATETCGKNVLAGSQCARLRAFERVHPSIQRWIRWQIPGRWFIGGTLPNDARLVQGYLLELTRALVTTLNYNVLPLLLGALAATAAAWLTIARKIAGHELQPCDLTQLRQRVLLGAFLGGVIGLLVAPGASNGLFAWVGPQAAPTVLGEANTSDTVALSPAIYGFLAGFATDRFFQLLDQLVERLFAFSNPKS
jgi:hypothetical protein